MSNTVSPGPDIIAEYGNWLRFKRRADYTVEQYVNLLRRIDRQMPYGVVTCTLDELVDWVYADGRSESTHAHYTAILRGFGRWLTDPADRRLEWHAAEDLPDVQFDSAIIRPASEEEFALIRERAAEPWLDLYELAGWAGLRCIEIHNLRREDITKQHIRVLGKGGKHRDVPTHPLLWQRFEARPAGPVALDRDGTPLTRGQVVSRGDYYLGRLGVEVSMHQLRKRFATRVYKTSGHNIRLVQHLLGHRFVSTTQRYLGVDGDEAVDIVSRLQVAC